MNLADARAVILVALQRMNATYNKTLFDEWMLVKLGSDQGAILAYEGPRAETYQKRFRTDVALLQRELSQRSLAVGDFEFVPEAHGTYYDACVRLGSVSYLFCNNTTKSMAEIRQDPLWIPAQKPFLDLAARFRADPVE